jgi:hypothetical protein
VGWGSLRDEIIKWMARCDKVICFYSAASFDRYYTKLERRLAEERERETSDSQARAILLYFRLDDSQLPSEYSHRLAINAWALTFEQACAELWRHIVERAAEPIRRDLTK